MKKVYILDEDAIDEFMDWTLKDSQIFKANSQNVYDAWLKDNPCPLPEMVSVPSEEEIDKQFTFKQSVDLGTSGENYLQNLDIRIGAKWLLSLLNLNS